jgi:AmiR/NasT family two-component response regulator
MCRTGYCSSLVVLVTMRGPALNSRVIIEQAKGVLAQRGGLRMDDAFDRLRRYARAHSVRLSKVAREVVEADLAAADVLGAPAVRKPAS